MARSFGLVDYKVQEAEYFLDQIRRAGESFDFRAVQFCASAFAAAARSITFAMQASLKHEESFNSWYEKKRKVLREDPLSRFFHDFRTVTQHIGVNAVVGGSSHGNKPVYYFGACADLINVPQTDVLTACETYFRRILEIVYECYIEFGPIIDGQQYFTQEYFEQAGKSIEDAEEEVGLPRGYTNLSGSDIEPYRWQYIRSFADGCLIEEQFERWLKKALPRKQLLPPFGLHS